MRKIIKSTLIFMTFIVVLLLCIFLYLKFNFNRNLDKNAFDSIVSDIQQTEKLPEPFITMYSRIHPLTDVNGIFYDGLRGENYRRCPCFNMTKLTYWPATTNFYKLRIQTDQYFYAKKLETKVSQEECLNAYTHKFDFLFKTIGIYQASRYYFGKELATLNEDEMITMVLMLQNPRRFNPKRSVSQKILANEVTRIKKEVLNFKIQ